MTLHKFQSLNLILYILLKTISKTTQRLTYRTDKISYLPLVYKSGVTHITYV